MKFYRNNSSFEIAPTYFKRHSPRSAAPESFEIKKALTALIRGNMECYRTKRESETKTYTIAIMSKNTVKRFCWDVVQRIYSIFFSNICYPLVKTVFPYYCLSLPPQKKTCNKWKKWFLILKHQRVTNKEKYFQLCGSKGNLFALKKCQKMRYYELKWYNLFYLSLLKYITDISFSISFLPILFDLGFEKNYSVNLWVSTLLPRLLWVSRMFLFI